MDEPGETQVIIFPKFLAQPSRLPLGPFLRDVVD